MVNGHHNTKLNYTIVGLTFAMCSRVLPSAINIRRIGGVSKKVVTSLSSAFTMAITTTITCKGHAVTLTNAAI